MQLLFFMDGLRFDLMKKDMPFLSSLNSIPLESEFGYSCACHASMYTGRYIQDHNTWFVWKKGDHSPYKFIDYIPGLKYLNVIPVKMVLSRIARLLNKNESFPGIPMLVNLPLKYWSLFAPCEDKFWTDEAYLGDMKTLFKILKEENVDHAILGLNKQGDVFKAAQKLKMREKDVIYYFIGQVDGYMHSYGAFQEITHKLLKDVDDFIKAEYEKACAVSDDVSIICWSDHGHIDVKEKIDINQFFRAYGLNVNTYIHLIESTFARFWFRNSQEQEDVIKVLKSMEENGLGFLFTKEIYERWHMNFKSNEHGDLIFHLKAPNTFTNTIWGFGHRYVSMHGYEPTDPRHRGVFIANKPIREDRSLAALVDIMPTICGNLNLDDSKYGFRGENLLEKECDN